MSEQLALGEVRADVPGLARRDHRDTAKQAAATVRSGTARFRVLARIVAASRDLTGTLTAFGITDEELCADLGMPDSTVRPRRVECVREGWVEAVPGKTRDSRFGKPMQLWRATDAGYAVYQAART